MKNILLGFILVIAFRLEGQDCNLSTHSTNFHDSWQSCEVAPNPNPNREASHWILYDLGYVYRIGSTKFWNYNVFGETEKGIRNFTIDYSTDAGNWIEAAASQLEEASGNESYEGETGPDLGGVEARYVLITILNTWGDACAGFSEVRFDVDGVVATDRIEDNQPIKIFPNPAQQIITLDTDEDVKELIILSSTGQELVRMGYQQRIDISCLPDGVYILRSVNASNKIWTSRFVKQGS